MTEEYNNYLIEIEQDQYPYDPRSDENLGTMICSHRRYDLGDVQWMPEYAESLEDFVHEYLSKEGIKKKDVIWLPLYLYDHSGITMSTEPFDCRWDSGTVGLIYITKKKAKEEYGWGRITKKRKNEIENYLSYEVETYDSYLTGEIYCYEIYEKENEEEPIDSCCGFYDEKDAIDEAKSLVDYYNEKKEKQKEK